LVIGFKDTVENVGDVFWDTVTSATPATWFLFLTFVFNPGNLHYNLIENNDNNKRRKWTGKGLMAHKSKLFSKICNFLPLLQFFNPRRRWRYRRDNSGKWAKVAEEYGNSMY